MSRLLSFHLFPSPRRRIEPVSVLGLGSLCSHTDICNIKPIYSRQRERERGMNGKPIGLHMQPERKRGSVQRGEHKRGFWVSKSCPCHLLVHENTARLMKVSEPGAARCTSLIPSFISVLFVSFLYGTLLWKQSRLMWACALCDGSLDVMSNEWQNCCKRRLSSYQRICLLETVKRHIWASLGSSDMWWPGYLSQILS